jgi:hypothetical protein
MTDEEIRREEDEFDAQQENLCAQMEYEIFCPECGYPMEQEG